MTIAIYVAAAIIIAVLCVLVFYLLSALEEVQGDIEEQRKFTNYMHTRLTKLEKADR